MELSLKSLVLFGSVVSTGLSAGLFYGWSVSVIPGTQKIMDETYLETMQSINKAILNSAFYLIFFGSLVCLSISSIYEFHSNKLVFWLMLTASISYFLGTFGVTVLGNVPLNDQLDVLNLTSLDEEKINGFRDFYESKWNRLHLIRTIFSVLAFILSVLAIFAETKKTLIL